jgi:hypothetical protein
MLLDEHTDSATPVEVVALARLALSSEIAPPPHLCPELEAKGWVNRSEDGGYHLTEEGLGLLEAFE